MLNDLQLRQLESQSTEDESSPPPSPRDLEVPEEESGYEYPYASLEEIESSATLISKLPAWKAVRVRRPKHPMAPPLSMVYFKYSEEYYPEDSVPAPFAATDHLGRKCRYIDNFLVYNRRGERLLPLETVDQSKHGTCMLYGELLPLQFMVPTPRGMEYREVRRRRLAKGVEISPDSEEAEEIHYPIRAEIVSWTIEYGPTPQIAPSIWIRTKGDCYYRLEEPAGRYVPAFETAKLKFDVCSRILKSLQANVNLGLDELIVLMTEREGLLALQFAGLDGGPPSPAFRLDLKRNRLLTGWGENFRIPDLRRSDVIELGPFIQKEVVSFARLLFGKNALPEETSPLVLSKAMQQLARESHLDEKRYPPPTPTMMYGGYGGEFPQEAAAMYGQGPQAPKYSANPYEMMAPQNPAAFPHMSYPPMAHMAATPWGVMAPPQYHLKFECAVHVLRPKILADWYTLSDEEQRAKWPYAATPIEQMVIGSEPEDHAYAPPITKDQIPPPFIDHSTYPAFNNRPMMPPPQPAMMAMVGMPPTVPDGYFGMG